VEEALAGRKPDESSSAEIFQAMRHQAEVDASAFERNLKLHKEQHQVSSQ
jgi:hypothetical protein